MSVWVATLLLSVASFGPEIAIEPNAVVVSSDRQVAMKLAETLYPKSTILGFGSRASIDSLSMEFSREPQLKMLEQSYPGLRDTILKRAPDVLEPLVENRLPALYSAMVDRLLATMSESDLGDALAFTEGSEGQALQRAGTDHVIKNYLEHGPFSPSVRKKVTESSKPPPVRDPRVAHWAKAHMTVGPVMQTWMDEQQKDRVEALGKLVETIISEMVDREPA